MEWRAASAAFESFGAALKNRQAQARLMASPSTPAVVAPSNVTTATFRRDGDTRTIRFGDLTVLMRDLKGLRYVERLLADPGREIHVLDLVAVEQGSLPTSDVAEHADGTSTAGAGLPVIDDAARDAYRRRLAEVDDDIEEAKLMNDLGRVDLAQRDREYLIAELTSAVGLAGRTRLVGGSTERARTSVTRALRYSLGRMATHHAALAAHLEHSVHTGTYCVYRPDPIAPLSWEL